jgi:hypothetical protein
LIIGDSVQNIGINAFTSYHTTATGKNVALKKVTIGKGIMTIGENAFESRNSDNTLFETLEEIVLDVKQDKVAGAPWGAVKAVITWIG